MSIVPSRLYLATRGDASFYEYLSSLGQISRLEASRLSESIDDTKQKRYVLFMSKWIPAPPKLLMVLDMS